MKTIAKIFFFIIVITVPSLAEDKPQVIITQMSNHPGLENAYHGILDALKDNKFEKDENFYYNRYNSQGLQSVNMQIAKKIFANPNNDVAVGISTPSIQSLISLRKDKSFPLIFSSVVNEKLLGEELENVTGATDYPPIDKMWEIVEQLPIKIKKIGVAYNASEPNSVAIVEDLKKNPNYEIITRTTDSSILARQSVVALIDRVDAILLIPDNTIVNAITIVMYDINKDYPEFPVIALDPELAYTGPMVSIGYNQYDIGYLAGEKLVRVLNGEKASDIPISSPDKFKIIFNKTKLENMKIELPSELLSQGEITKGLIEDF